MTSVQNRQLNMKDDKMQPKTLKREKSSKKFLHPKKSAAELESSRSRKDVSLEARKTPKPKFSGNIMWDIDREYN